MLHYKEESAVRAWNEYIERSVFLKNLKEQGEDLILPDHNSELLRGAFQERYERRLSAFIKRNKTNNIPVDGFAKLHHRLKWLEDDVLPLVDSWLSKTHPNGIPKDEMYLRESDVIERERFKAYTISEIEELKRKLSEYRESPDILLSTTVKLSHAQIAILHHIANLPITPNNANDIAQKYGQSSGQKLEFTYKELTSELVRTAKSKYRVKDYESISELIPEAYKSKYNKELNDTRKNNGK